MKPTAIVISVVFFFTSCSGQNNQTAAPDDFIAVLRKAEKEYSSRNWKAAIPLWEQVTKQNPTHIRYWYNLSDAYYQNKDYEQAIRAFEKCNELTGGKSYWEAFHLAKTYARMGNRDLALQWAVNAFNLGLPERQIFSDAAFDELRSLPEFQRIAGTKDVSKLSRIEGWRYDLKFLHEEITRKAYQVTRAFTKSDLEAEVKKIHELIPSLTDMQITTEFIKLMVKVDDGHTMLYAFRENAELLKCIPVEFYWFREGLYIVQAEKRFKHLLGSKVVSIEDKTPEAVFVSLDPLINRDNPMALKVLGIMRVRHTAMLHAIGISKSPDELSLNLVDPGGKSLGITLKGDSQIPSRKLWDGLPDNWEGLENTIPNMLPHLKNRYTSYWHEYIEGDKTVWLHYNQVFDDPTKPWSAYLDELFQFINNNPVEKLVIDLRNNNGGNGELSYPLVHKLIRCDKINQHGRLFVVTGRKTFSAAGICISLLEKHTKAVFAGEPAGTSPAFTGEEFPFELPYSHLAGNVSDREHHYAEAVDFRTWIPPVLYAAPSYIDFMKGYDPIVDAIRNFR